MGKAATVICLFALSGYLLSGCAAFSQRNYQSFHNPAPISDRVAFSLDSGFYPVTMNVTLSTQDPEATIYYTTDGSEPTFDGYAYVRDGNTVTVDRAIRYNDAISINRTTMIRARVCKQGSCGPDQYRTYFINEFILLPVVSLAVDPRHLYDDLVGIYTSGNNKANENVPSFGPGNVVQAWERPVHIEFFNKKQRREIKMNAGIRIFGGYSRNYLQKSLAIFARPDYGPSAIPNKFFSVTGNMGPITALKSIVLRNSGDDWHRTMFRDGMVHSLLENVDIEKQGFQPSIVFINGQYFGIHNIREKINQAYLASHYANVDPDKVDMLYYYDSRIAEGNNTDFKTLVKFVEERDMGIEAFYDYVAERIDINNFIDYMAVEVYINNTDWPFSNIKYWRSQAPGSKWRWILHDTDGAFAGRDWVTTGENAVDHDTINYIFIEDTKTDSATLFTGLFKENAGFRTAFLNRLAELRDNQFAPARVNDRITQLRKEIRPEIARHKARWVDSADNWEDQITTVRNFANDRPAHITNIINKYK